MESGRSNSVGKQTSCQNKQDSVNVITIFSFLGKKTFIFYTLLKLLHINIFYMHILMNELMICFNLVLGSLDDLIEEYKQVEVIGDEQLIGEQ